VPWHPSCAALLPSHRVAAAPPRDSPFHPLHEIPVCGSDRSESVTLLWIVRLRRRLRRWRLPGAGAPPARWEALSDTTLCVVDRTSATGLTNLAARVESDGRIVLLENRRIVPLEQVHPVSLLAGYAGREPWV
jgi:hypothetical protein